jgi:hypothetical protein
VLYALYINFLQKRAKGEELLETVANKLNLVEKDYFGLQFIDTHDAVAWVDGAKRVAKQIKGQYTCETLSIFLILMFIFIG